jgi:hypothetical protein
MASGSRPSSPVQPTNAVPLAGLFAYTQSVGLERWLAQRVPHVVTPARIGARSRGYRRLLGRRNVRDTQSQTDRGCFGTRAGRGIPSS